MISIDTMTINIPEVLYIYVLNKDSKSNGTAPFDTLSHSSSMNHLPVLKETSPSSASSDTEPSSQLLITNNTGVQIAVQMKYLSSPLITTH